MNCQTFSTGLSSGHFGVSRMMVMLAGTTRRVDMCQRCEPRRRTRFLSCRSRAPWRARFPPGARESFFKILNRALRLRMVARSGREFAVAHGAQLPAERLLGDRDAEFLEDPLRQIDQPPAHHAMDRRDRAALDHAGDGPPL